MCTQCPVPRLLLQHIVQEEPGNRNKPSCVSTTNNTFARVPMRKRKIKYNSGVQLNLPKVIVRACDPVRTSRVSILQNSFGYGHSTPQTVGGKVFCMFYAINGIPLGIVMFQSVGERLNTFVTFLLKQIKKCFRLKSTEVSQTNLIFIAGNLSVIVLTTGAAIFSYFEGWVYIDSFYYCFITLTTIGFGDLVALQKDDMLTNQPEYVTFCLIFILFGLTVISAAMNLLILRFLTMNTVDERREEMEAAAAARGAVRLDGDVITSNGNVVSGSQETPEYNDLISVCSCSCYNLRSRGKPRYSVTRAPGKIAHLLPGPASSKEESHSCTDDSASCYQNLGKKRASI
ncbi:two pore potassium channel protein sup-9-like [Aplysia californica]|uniref:Two pore potassium channel protein sup-9-like n=1 Tax=Aplysia californica TaxID=6500 RepID=A0ABM1A8C3_APLCA|nr:two pore potassium channel protein sup-9-like [Aplysia californica]